MDQASTTRTDLTDEEVVRLPFAEAVAYLQRVESVGYGMAATMLEAMSVRLGVGATPQPQ